MNSTPTQTETANRRLERRPATKTNRWIFFAIIGTIVIVTLLPMIQAWQAVNAFEQTATDAGFTLRQAVSLIVDEPVNEPTYLRGFESVAVNDGATAELAIASTHATLSGTFTQTVAFMGKDLVILPGAVIEGDLQIAAAKSVTIRGTVHGEILGNFGRIFRPEPTQELPPASPIP